MPETLGGELTFLGRSANAHSINDVSHASVVPGGPSTGNGLDGRTCAAAGCRTLPVDRRVGVRRLGLDGQGELLASQRGGGSPPPPSTPSAERRGRGRREGRWRRRRWTRACLTAHVVATAAGRRVPRSGAGRALLRPHGRRIDDHVRRQATLPSRSRQTRRLAFPGRGG
jgi:hypothetical protein